MKYKEYINSKQWWRLRNEAMALNNGKCVYCQKPAIEVHHHTYPPGDRWELDKLSNLQPVCEPCHDKLHPPKGNTMKLKLIDSKSYEIKKLDGTDVYYIQTEFARLIPVLCFVETCLKIKGKDAATAAQVILNEAEILLLKLSKRNTKFRDLNAVQWFDSDSNKLYECFTYEILREATSARCNNIQARLNDPHQREHVTLLEARLVEAFEEFLVVYMPVVSLAFAKLQTGYESNQLQIRANQQPLAYTPGADVAAAIAHISNALAAVPQALAGLEKRTADPQQITSAVVAAVNKGIVPSWVPNSTSRRNAETLIGIQAKELFGAPPASVQQRLSGSTVMVDVAARPFWQWIDAIETLQANDWVVTKDNSKAPVLAVSGF